jgi:hypothetical protein
MLFVVVLLHLACSSSVLGLGHQQLQQTHSMQQEQQDPGSSSSLQTACNSTGGLSPAAAARIASSMAGDARLHITAVRLVGSCDALRLLSAAETSSSSMPDSSTGQHAAAVLLSSSLATDSSNLTVAAAAAAEGGALLQADTPAAADNPAAFASGPAAPAAQDSAVQLHIDFTVARDAPFFADLVLRYSSSSTSPAVQAGSTAPQASIWIQPAGSFLSEGQRRESVLSDSTGQLLLQEQQQQQQQQQQRQQQGAGAGGSRELLWKGQADGLSTVIDLVPSLSQVSEGGSGAHAVLWHAACTRIFMLWHRVQGYSHAQAFATE